MCVCVVPARRGDWWDLVHGLAELPYIPRVSIHENAKAPLKP